MGGGLFGRGLVGGGLFGRGLVAGGGLLCRGLVGRSGLVSGGVVSLFVVGGGVVLRMVSRGVVRLMVSSGVVRLMVSRGVVRLMVSRGVVLLLLAALDVDLPVDAGHLGLCHGEAHVLETLLALLEGRYERIKFGALNVLGALMLVQCYERTFSLRVVQNGREGALAAVLRLRLRVARGVHVLHTLAQEHVGR